LIQPALLARPLHQGYIQCTACEHWCAIAPGEAGRCGVRRNLHGRLQLVVYGTAMAAHVDPIEKKPLHHFLPGSEVLSIGTVGCNLTCTWCQNWELSQWKDFDPDTDFIGQEWPPETLVATACRDGIPSLAFTYNEPAIYVEYALDTAQLAASQGIHCIFVSSGFETLQAIDRLAPYLSAANIDLKAFAPATYRRHCGARVEPVLRNIRHLVEQTGIWTEVTTLVIPGLNDGDDELRAIAEFLVSVSPDLPWHVSGFIPHYQMHDRPPTPAATLRRAWEIGRRAGLHYVYTGNIWGSHQLDGCSDTLCPQCETLLIERAGYQVRPRWLEPGQCHNCGTTLAGRWS
jgi:pyruvate formate lyase activating enzyme